MKKKTLLLIAIFSLFVGTTNVSAGEISIFPIPRDMDHLTVENFIKAIHIVNDAGTTLFFCAPKWGEIEPSAGNFTFESALGGTKYVAEQEGIDDIYFGLQLINTVKREVPPDLQNTAWDDPQLIARFEKMIAVLSKEKIGTIHTISIGNEVDVYFEQHPDELAPYIRFMKAVRPALEKYFPHIPVGTTVTFEGLRKGRGDIISQLIDISEVVYFTYYPVIDLVPQPIADIPSHIAQMQTAAGNKKIILQEIGFPAGTVIGSSNEMQAAFFKSALPLFQSNTQIEAGFIFALHDFSPQLCDTLKGYYGATAWPKKFQDGFADFLCTLGLLESNGNPRPSYDIVRQILTQKK